MSANVTTIRSSADGRKQELIDKAVSDIFDELLTEISTKTKLHHSEQVSRDNRMPNCNNSKIYDFVNSYHAFCKFCEQHFYSRSVANDINSFFQKHVNTSYHRQQRMACLCPDDVPILTWEETLHSAKCNVCDLSGLNPFVISTKFCIRKLMRQHVCLWPWDQRETNEKFLRKLILLKKYCGLKIFREKFLKTVDGREVCLLCGVILPWSKEKAGCHLKSEMHYQNFCVFIWKNFYFSPKDILNGFNLETVTRWLIVYDPPMWTKFADYNELAVCLMETNNCKNPYPEDKKNGSYSPALVGKLLQDEEIDFISKNQCLLCNVEMGQEHFSSSMHRTKAVDLNENSFTPKNYVTYLQNRQRRLLPYSHVIDSYEKLRDELKEETCMPLPLPLPLTAHYVKSLFAEKLSLVDKVITTTVDDAVLFCHLCDQYLRKSHQKVHLGSDNHNARVEKWNELRKNLSSDRFLEPFRRFGNVIVCLLCGAVIHTKRFFFHLKDGMHARKLELYTSLDLGIPMSSAFQFQEDFSCFCTICNSKLGKSPSLKVMLKNMTCHWPCEEMKRRKKKDHTSEMEVVIQQDANLAEAMADPHEDCGGETEVEITKVEKKEESVARTSDETVMTDVLDKSSYSTKCLDNSRSVVDGKVKTERIVDVKWQSAVVKESACDKDKGLELSSCRTPACTSSTPTAENGDREEEAVEEKKEVKNKLRSEAMKVNSVNEQKGKENEEIEVLLIKGLPKKKRKFQVIYSLFEAFGKIQSVTFDSKIVVLAFAERGIAGAAALEAKNILREPKIGVMVSERKLNKKGKSGELALDKEVINVLQEPQKLMEFVLCLIFQAMTASQSPVETKREEMVCNMIVQAVMGIYPLCRCYPFGSRLTGLSLSNSDLDVFLDCGGMYSGFTNTSPNTEKKLVRKVAGVLRKVGDVSDIIVVDNARVPIISFRHKPTNLDCDISFKNGLSIQNSLLIKFLISLDWRVKPMLLFMKYWAKQNGLHGSPYFSSYALSMLVINYLEQLESPVLPTIESLQNSYVGRRVTIGGWDCSFNTKKSILPTLDNIDPVPTLLVGLFEFYATFDFSKNVVFPLTGKALPRESFSDSGKGKLPMCYKRHILNLLVPLEHLVSDKFPICIIDPFDLSHVLTKSFTSQGLMQFIYFCQMSRQYLKKGLADSSTQ